ncbi:hypothetical protein [Sphaerotilus mobilis]|uniref:Uncharacterized protein n=1 Tax=Sphaerotilus mobilis TaxID=47994 RepID=A0A4Q7LSY2_9BURK|nr:hypothetical protein [Sphaerotilus mobilis]RZS57118.1 hypothetical protein EV685_1682 [Sphaerotilus mobilis]
MNLLRITFFYGIALLVGLSAGALARTAWTWTSSTDHGALLTPTSVDPTDAVSTGHAPTRQILAPGQVWIALGHALVPAQTGPLALPHGSRLRLKVTPSADGLLRLRAISPDGRHTDLWSLSVSAGQTQFSPMLRLEGHRGLEQLELHLTPSDGSAARQQQLQIWHG